MVRYSRMVASALCSSVPLSPSPPSLYPSHTLLSYSPTYSLPFLLHFYATSDLSSSSSSHTWHSTKISPIEPLRLLLRMLDSHVMSYHIISYHIMHSIAVSCHVMSCHVMSCYVMSCHFMLCHVRSSEKETGNRKKEAIVLGTASSTAESSLCTPLFLYVLEVDITLMDLPSLSPVLHLNLPCLSSC